MSFRARFHRAMHPCSHRNCRVLLLLVAIVTGACARAADVQRPNFVVILCDNLGNGDIACFNPGTKHRTPNLDRMAAEGRKFTSFYSASGVCTPSRAALMTGCYPRRVGLHISCESQAVLKPVDKKGINPSEETIAELLKGAGYVTTCIGKWHLGDQPEFLPTRNGFDSYFGIPYSEDMVKGRVAGKDWPDLPLMRDEKVIEAPVDVQHLARRFTEEAVKFITRNKDKPFFLYFPEAGPGSRKECYPGPAFRGKSANGLYGDSIEELDWSAGEIMKALKQNGLDEKTIVVWTNDNGAVQRNPPQGSNAPYKGMGYTTSEGGQRMPCIVRWPGKVPAATACDDLCTMMDLLPTVAALAGSVVPPSGGSEPAKAGTTKPIDGHDMCASWFGDKSAASPYDETGFFYYQITQLQAVRAGPWKLYLPLKNKRATLAAQGEASPPQLYDVRNDVTEEHEASAAHPDIVQRLTQLAERARLTLGDGNTRGSEQRDSGWVGNPRPQLLGP